MRDTPLQTVIKNGTIVAIATAVLVIIGFISFIAVLLLHVFLYLSVCPKFFISICQAVGFVGCMLVFYLFCTTMPECYRVRNVLQPNNIEQTKLVAGMHELKGDARSSIYQTMFVGPFYQKISNNFPNNFFNPLNRIKHQARKKVYTSAVLIIIGLCFLVFMFSASFRGYCRHFCRGIIVLLVIMLAYVHGVVGVNYEFPIVNVVYSKSGQQVSMKGVVLLRDEGGFQRIVARNYYMALYSIPSNAISIIEQVSVVDLFKNCARLSDEGVELCESYYW